jgi:3-deoxy-D-arabino-heptulosonate 7-phosphate (DAHP) synthase class II
MQQLWSPGSRLNKPAGQVPKFSGNDQPGHGEVRLAPLPPLVRATGIFALKAWVLIR